MRQRDRYRELDLKLLGEAMISDHGLAVLRQLCDTHGSRFAGSADERRAGQFLLSSFRDWGLDKVRAEPFALTAWRRGRKPALKTLGPRPVALAARRLARGASTSTWRTSVRGCPRTSAGCAARSGARRCS